MLLLTCMRKNHDCVASYLTNSFLGLVLGKTSCQIERIFVVGRVVGVPVMLTNTSTETMTSVGSRRWKNWGPSAESLGLAEHVGGTLRTWKSLIASSGCLSIENWRGDLEFLEGNGSAFRPK